MFKKYVYIYIYLYIWMFPKIVVPQNGWFMMENPIKERDVRDMIGFRHGNLHTL